MDSILHYSRFVSLLSDVARNAKLVKRGCTREGKVSSDARGRLRGRPLGSGPSAFRRGGECTS